MKIVIGFLFSVSTFLMLTVSAGAQVSVNGLVLDQQTRNVMAQTYGPVPDGDYWYDQASGLWGAKDGPGLGRIMPGLQFGALLRADASGGGDGTLTAVFINGREIHPQELTVLKQLFGYVNPGRYWLGSNMQGGYEGGPAIFDLRASAASGSGGGYNKNTAFGGLMSDGQCSGYLHPSGASVMTGNC